MASAQVHRFRDRVAAYLGNGETVYLAPDEAERLSALLAEAAKDCRDVPDFSKSQFRSQEFKLKPREEA